MEFDFQFLDDTYSLERENKDEEVKSQNYHLFIFI